MTKPSLMSELNEEHKNLLAAGPRLAELLKDLEFASETSAQTAVENFRTELRRFREALLNHFRREEALFATVKQAVVEKVDLATDVLGVFLAGEAESDLQAHGALTSQTGKMVALLKEPSTNGGLEPEARKRLRELFDATFKLLRSHAASEDQIIFPIIVHVLRKEQITEVWEHLQPADENQRILVNP